MLRTIFKKNVFVVLLALAVILLPLERIGSVDFGGVTIRASQVIILLTLVLFLLKGFLNKRMHLFFPGPYVFYFLFLLSSLFSILFARDQERGIFIFVFLFFMFLVSFSFTLVLDKKEKIKMIVDAFLYSSFFFSILGIMQFIGDMVGIPNSITGLSGRYVSSVMGVTRIQSTFIEPLYFANFLLIPIFVSIFFILHNIEEKNKKKYLVMLMVFIVSLILTFSKGAIAAFGVMVIALFLFQVRSIFNKKNIPYLLVIFATFSSLAFGVYSTLRTKPDIERFYSRISEVMLGGSVSERREAYSVAIEAFGSSPIVGVGVGGFGPYFAGYPVSAPDYGWAITNNEYLEVLAETGVLGLGSFLIFLFSLIFYSVKSYIKTKDKYLKSLLIGMCFAFVAILIQYMTFSTLYIMHIWVLIGLIISAQNIVLLEKDE